MLSPALPACATFAAASDDDDDDDDAGRLG